ncbi:MAG: DMT family transporter [Candidatus Thorarchaeota archaeon]
MDREITARLMLIVSSTIWGTTFVVGKVALVYLGPLHIVLFENGLGALVLALALIFRGRGDQKGPLIGPFFCRTTVILGCLNGLAYCLQYVGLGMTTAGQAGVLVNVGVTFVPIFVYAVVREMPVRREIAALVISVIGAILVSTGGDPSMLLAGETLGNLLVFSAGVVWALWIVIAQMAMSQVGGALRTAVPNAVYTTLVMVPAALMLEDVLPAGISNPVAQLSILYLGVMSIGVAYLLYYKGLEHTGGTTSAVYLMLQPVVAVAMGAWLLLEVVTPAIVAGTAMVLLALGLARRKGADLDSPVQESAG